MLVNGEEVAFGGRVVWVSRGDAGLNVRGRMGVRFTRVPWDLQRLIDASVPAGRGLLRSASA